MAKKGLVLVCIIHLLLVSCEKEPDDGTIKIKTPDWSEATHGNDTPPDYSVVFMEAKVLKFEIIITADDWTKMQTDLTANIKTGNPPPPINPLWEPVWVPCSFRFNGKEWYKVGIRYKGNSSLKETVNKNIKKYSFKLDFDEFEDVYPAIKNQRFYGFKQLNMANGFSDLSLIREKVTTDLFRESGIPAARAAFCEVWIDFGQGLKYFGLYTLIEEVDDTVIKTQFTEGGNLYKPEGPAATFAAGTFNTSKMDKKTNLETLNYSDVQALYNTINSGLRTSNPETWKVELNKIFDIPHFLKWLAINTVIQNWDTYGKMSHNYYLYNNPETGKLTWIPWDNNESLNPGKQGGALSLSLSEVSNGWPLIRFLLNDPILMTQYNNYMRQFTTSFFGYSKMSQTFDTHASLIRNYAMSELPGFTFLTSPSAFNPAVEGLKSHVQSRQNAVNLYLGN